MSAAHEGAGREPCTLVPPSPPEHCAHAGRRWHRARRDVVDHGIDVAVLLELENGVQDDFLHGRPIIIRITFRLGDRQVVPLHVAPVELAPPV